MQSSSNPSPPALITLATVAAPLLVASLVPFLFEIEVATAGALFLVATMVALGLVAWRCQGGAAGAKAPTGLLDTLVKRDYAASKAAAEAAGLLTPELSTSLDHLVSRHEEQQRNRDGARKSLEALGVGVTSLGEAFNQQVGSLADLQSAFSSQSAGGDDQRVDELASNAEQSASSIIEMVAINNEVRENLANLASSVEETTSAIEEMTFSSKEVAKNIDELSTAAEETAASMNQMDVSINQVETNANETTKLSEQVTRDADTGVSAINRTITGIDKIMESSNIASQVITSLGEKINQIGNILNVIDDVAEQTNLLALNAAIIAAQAGEHGRGFAVVADEIKALAERTGDSTKEISILIKGIQDESRNAVTVISGGTQDVEEGVRLGREAEAALRKIFESAKRSTLMIQAIAQATVEQAKGSKQVTNAISRIAETVQQIAFATAEQAKGAEHIMQSAERMKIITQGVERSADEQNRGGRQITESIESIRETAESLAQSSREQTQGGERLGQEIASMSEAADLAQDSSHQIAQLLGEVVAQVDSLTDLN